MCASRCQEERDRKTEKKKVEKEEEEEARDSKGMPPTTYFSQAGSILKFKKMLKKCLNLFCVDERCVWRSQNNLQESSPSFTTLVLGVNLRSPGLVQGPLPIEPFHMPRPQLLRVYPIIY